MAGQYRKTQQQIQHELDEIHHLISQGASDEYIIKNRNLDRRMFYRYKHRLYKQTAQMYQQKRREDIFYDILLCKERLTHDRISALDKANETKNPLWGQLATELAVSILKLENEGIKVLEKHNNASNNISGLEEKDRPIILDSTGQPATVLEVQPSEQQQQSTNDERQF
jgi:hypothetical protein